MDQLMRTDDGQILWYNRQTNSYQLVELQGEHSDLFCPAKPVLEVESPDFEPSSNDSCTNNVGYTPGNHIGAKANVWDKDQTLSLLDLCQQHHDELTNPSADQCANRMKTLIVKYKEVKDHNARSGNHPKEWQYFEQEANYLGGRPGITPPAACSSISKSMATSRKENDKKKKKVRSSPRTDMLHWLNEYKADVERREER
ncbi:unnamed protein product [Phaedon cochleariae]|uniref:Uncharacterized protein n=1 Tax=Phaedon cochleariae TaxID=80249 RepID=A0A9N9SKL0_PHACE|nr:unnamed protein product [Phaedon cochleariae]